MDIVDRLLSTGEHLAKEAAYEIERLREALRDLIHKLDDDFDNGKPVKKLDVEVARKALGEKE